MSRIATIKRKTKETDIELTIDLDGSGKSSIDTGIGFFDHMLESFARHGLFDLDLKVKGDLNVDTHHTVEDTGIVLGQALKEALGDKAGIKRFGNMILPMDESVVMAAIDISGRPFLIYDINLTVERVGDFECEMSREFFYALCVNAGINLYLKELEGANNHHILEATFKAFAKALDEATMLDARIKGVPSTKGVL